VISKTDCFCNNLCKYSFDKKNNSEIETAPSNFNQRIPEDLKFHVDLPNLKFNKLVVRGSHYGYPKLYLNDKKVKPLLNLKIKVPAGKAVLLYVKGKSVTK
jgi:hypothetical protein